MYYTNPQIDRVHRIFDQNERSGYLRLDLNENPDPIPGDIVKDVLNSITPEFVSQYPETVQFQNRLAGYLNTSPENVCLTNGSSEAVRYVIEGFTSVKGRIVSVTPSYFMFQIYSEMYDRNIVQIKYNDDMTMDINNIIDALTDDTELLILLNPNNPVGNTYTTEEFERLLDEAERRKITVLVDEAYFYFYPVTFINYALEREHIFVTRTFSKLFAMAGCRLGYVAGWKEGVKIVQKLCTPHNVNGFALAFAERLLDSPGVVDAMIEKFNEGRKYLISELDRLGYDHLGQAGNFIFIKPKTDADLIVDRMKNEHKILVKSYNGIGIMGKCLRVSIGGKECMERFITALTAIDK